MHGPQTIEVCRAAHQSIVIAINMETFDFDTVSRKDFAGYGGGSRSQRKAVTDPGGWGDVCVLE